MKKVEPPTPSVTRRQAIGAGVLAAGAISGCGRPESKPAGRDESAPVHASRAPAVFIPHGGGPWPFVDLGFADPSEVNDLAAYLRSLKALAHRPPRALLVISAHWEEAVPTVMTAASPPILYDYYGFPPESYRIQWPAPGQPSLALRVRELLHGAGFDSAEDSKRGFDHGTFIPLKLTYPDADVPTLQLSLVRGLDPERHVALGRALAPLRDEDVLIVGSGMTYHNLRKFGPSGTRDSETFDAWLRESALLSPADREKRFVAWESAPSARAAHPREEHLLPLFVVAGAAGEDRASVAWNGRFGGTRQSAYHFG